MTALVHLSGYEVCGVVSIRQLGRRGLGAGTCGEEGQEFVTGNAWCGFDACWWVDRAGGVKANVGNINHRILIINRGGN